MASKFALVIANTEYQDASFAKLTAPGKDAEEFAEVLRHAELAAFEDVQVLLNEGESKIRRSIARFFADRKRDDLLLLYFSGHGIRNGQGQLFLAATDTEINILEATGIPADFITYAMNNSRSQRQLLILDCCNSGAFAHGTKSASAVGSSMGIATAFEGSGFGRVVLTATDATQYAWEGDKLIGDTQKSVFTHFLIEGLKGDADRNSDGRIDVDELYDYAYEQVVQRTPKQTPGKWSYRQQGDIVLRENLKPRDVKPTPLPSELLEMLSHPNSGVRRAGIQELISLLDGKHLGWARAAQEKLHEIAENDDSLSLRKTANETLIARGFVIEQPAPLPVNPSPIVNPEINDSVEKKQPEKIKSVDRASPRVDIKDNELEEEVHPRPVSENATVNKKPLPLAKPIPWRSLGFVTGGLLVAILLIWGGSKFLKKIPVPTPAPTQPPAIQPAAMVAMTVTEAPMSAATEASTQTPTKAPATPAATEAPTLAALHIGSTTTGKDGMTLLYVPAGEFTMGSDTGDGNHKPVHKVSLYAFWIDQTEVTNAMYARCVQDGKCNAPSSNKSSTRSNYFGNSVYDSYPVIYVSWENAKDYCSWANRRLPTEAEWEKAARGDDAREFPWGSNAPNINLLNYADTGIGDTDKVGTYPSGASVYGALDMAGNVSEWVGDWYRDQYYATSPASNPLGPEKGSARVIRGGSWAGSFETYCWTTTDGTVIKGCNVWRNNFITWIRSWDIPQGKNQYDGFRCAMSSTP